MTDTQVVIQDIGAQGPIGPPELTAITNWDVGTNYALNQEVQWQDTVYLALTPNLGVQPDINPLVWKPLVVETKSGVQTKIATRAPLQYVPEGMATSAAIGLRPLHFDDFKRSDRILAWNQADGEQSPSGVRYKCSGQGVDNFVKPRIVNGHCVFQDDFGNTDCQISGGGHGSPMQLVAQLEEMIGVAACETVFVPNPAGNSTWRCSTVLGCSAVSFATSSVQFAIWIDDANGNGHWQVFWTATGLVNQILATGSLLINFEVRNSMIMHHDGPNSALHLYVNGAYLSTVQDPNINIHWGAQLVGQQRRDNLGDPSAEFCAIGAAA